MQLLSTIVAIDNFDTLIFLCHHFSPDVARVAKSLGFGCLNLLESFFYLSKRNIKYNIKISIFYIKYGTFRDK